MIMKIYGLITAIVFFGLSPVFGQGSKAVAVVGTKECQAFCKANTSKKALLLQAMNKNVTENTYVVSNSGMIWVGGGEFNMGTNDFPDAKPVHKVSIKG